MKKRKILILFLIVTLTFVSCTNKNLNTVENIVENVDKNKKEYTNTLTELADEVIINEDDVIFTDVRGEEVSISKNPENVAGLLNSYTNLWYIAGGTVKSRIDSDAQLYEEVINDDSIQKVGGLLEVNVELLLNSDPDLVLLRNGKQGYLIPQLEQNGVEFITMEYNSFKDYLKYLKIFTALTGNEDLYESKGLNVAKDINKIINMIPDENNPDVLLILGTSKSLKAFRSNTANGEMIKELKANNIADAWENTEATSIEINTEYLIANDPEYILIQAMNDTELVEDYINETVAKMEWWQSLRAVQNDNVIYLDRDLFHFKPNDRYGEAYAEMASILYPEIFKEE